MFSSLIDERLRAIYEEPATDLPDPNRWPVYTVDQLFLGYLDLSRDVSNQRIMGLRLVPFAGVFYANALEIKPTMQRGLIERTFRNNRGGVLHFVLDCWKIRAIEGARRVSPYCAPGPDPLAIAEQKWRRGTDGA